MVEQVHLPFGKLYFSDDWSSQKNDHRKLIREDLFKKMNEPDLLDLSKIPSNTNISISHCSLSGGYFISNSGVAGFDLESCQRVKKNLIDRIANENEKALIPQDSLFYIWCIKEASFKAFSKSNQQIKTMSEVKLVSFNEESGTVSFKDHQVRFFCGTLKSNLIFASVVAYE